jgi:hypothetical protein
VPAFASLCSATVRLPATEAKELKVWAHRVTADGDSEGLPAVAEVRAGGEPARFDLGVSGGQVVLPLIGGPFSVRIALPERRHLDGRESGNGVNPARRER